ncbi:alpha/beta fold hydrolase [Paenibacillus endoradicis]|uniref:alpha/beta fold hydrolase n=1 Tax=Paenibacillus endoradicis TaxID=2972487 RepID=UPI002158E192|nr:alpha/beta hydrolase [Paenibacillus endoradicis]MCR8658771.1 alpha/beta hydrolase [Paenibacillus endoradicis]
MVEVVVRNNVKMIGEGEQVIILAHGFGCDQSMWQYITPSLAKKYRLVLFDYVGSGQSDLSAYTSERYNSLNGYMQDLLEVMEEAQLRDVIFIGHSISSMIGMLASIERPEWFQKLIMIGPSPRYLNDENGYYGGFERSDIVELLEMMEMNFSGWASFMAPMAMNNLDQPQFSQQLEQSFASSNPVIARQFAEVTFFSDYRTALAKCSTPTLIMQCAEDSVVPMEVGHYLHQNIAGSTLCLMEAKGHYPHISHPIETLAAITQYIEIQ